MKTLFPTRGIRARYPAGAVIQGYGENPELYQASTANLKYHNGWDIVGVYDSDILAPHNGIIELVDYPDNSYGYGNNVILLSDAENGIVIQSTLGHNTPQRLIKRGDIVKQGQVIAKMGNSGFVVSGGVRYWGGSNPDKRGTHVHWTVKRFEETTETGIELFQFFGKNYKLLASNNGVRGAFDPAELFEGETMTKYFKVDDHGKLGIMILEGFTGSIIFENDFAEYQKLLEITGIDDQTPTISIP